jgi:hypothetical protein
MKGATSLLNVLRASARTAANSASSSARTLNADEESIAAAQANRTTSWAKEGIVRNAIVSRVATAGRD